MVCKSDLTQPCRHCLDWIDKQYDWFWYRFVLQNTSKSAEILRIFVRFVSLFYVWDCHDRMRHNFLAQFAIVWCKDLLTSLSSASVPWTSTHVCKQSSWLWRWPRKSIVECKSILDVIRKLQANKIPDDIRNCDRNWIVSTTENYG
jgi:hypothetical protein